MEFNMRPRAYYSIFYAKSSDGGKTWTTPIVLANNALATDPVLVAGPENALYLAWGAETHAGAKGIYFRKSTDGGASWSPPKPVGTGPASYPGMALASDGRIHLVWSLKGPSYYDLVYRNSRDGGATWSAPKVLFRKSLTGRGASIAVEAQGRIHIAWGDYFWNSSHTLCTADLFYSNSADQGKTWTDALNLSHTEKKNTWAGYFSNPDMDIAADAKGGIHLVYSNWDEVLYRKSVNGGESWLSPRNLSNTPNSSNYSNQPRIVVDEKDRLMVIWAEFAHHACEDIYGRESINRGSAWGIGQNISSTKHFYGRPSIAADGSGNVHIAWDDSSYGSGEVLYRKATR
jgi:hypothetical protein